MLNMNLDTAKVIVTLGNEGFFREHNLDGIAHDRFLDLLVVYKEMHETDEGIVTRTILTSEVEELGMSMEEFDAMARENTARLLPAELKDFGVMKIITNRTSAMGASAILYSDVMAEAAAEIGGDIYLLPSSIHEFIVVPARDFDPGTLVQMIRDANGTVVRDNEILSDHPYHYCRTTGEVTIA